MTPDRFRECLALAHWSQNRLATILGCDERMARRWAAGSAVVPESVAGWLEAIAAAHIANPVPPPASWRQRRLSD